MTGAHARLAILRKPPSRPIGRDPAIALRHTNLKQDMLVAVTTRLRDLLTITKLVTVFDSYDKQADAVASFTTSA